MSLARSSAEPFALGGYTLSLACPFMLKYNYFRILILILINGQFYVFYFIVYDIVFIFAGISYLIVNSQQWAGLLLLSCPELQAATDMNLSVRIVLG